MIASRSWPAVAVGRRGFGDATHCRRGHDLRLPRAIGTDGAAGNRFCRLCRNERKMQSLERQRLKARCCSTCRRPLQPGGTWRFCSTACENVSRGQCVADNAKRTTFLLNLYDKLERETRAWLRADLRRQIDAELAKETSR